MRLVRHCYGDDQTEGRLYLGDDTNAQVLRTIERPWIPDSALGGRPSVSCVPDGTYVLARHERPNGDVVLALRNSALGVFSTDDEVPDAGGRSLILIHPANWAHELLGCIAPGMGRTIDDERRPMVTESRRAMALVMETFEAGDATLVIEPFEARGTE